MGKKETWLLSDMCSPKNLAAIFDDVNQTFISSRRNGNGLHFAFSRFLRKTRDYHADTSPLSRSQGLFSRPFHFVTRHGLEDSIALIWTAFCDEEPTFLARPKSPYLSGKNRGRYVVCKSSQNNSTILKNVVHLAQNLQTSFEHQNQIRFKFTKHGLDCRSNCLKNCSTYCSAADRQVFSRLTDGATKVKVFTWRQEVSGWSLVNNKATLWGGLC